MPSDATLSAALAAVAPAHAAWHSAVAATAEDVRGMLDRQAPPSDVGAGLGPFAAGRIDLSRFAGLAVRRTAVDAPAGDALRRAAETLAALALAPLAELGVVRVAPGASMRDAVLAGWMRLGRAFGAAHAVALVQQGRYGAEAEGGLARGLPPGLWTRRERRVAPPLVVLVAGADLDVGALVPALDGGAKIVLLVDGPCSPAPLVRLVTPGVLVLQTSTPADLAILARTPGPAVAAVVPDDAAAFLHDPARGPSLAARLTVSRVPPAGARGPVGPWSAAQQAEELAQLATLVTLATAQAAAQAAGEAATRAAAAAPDGAPAPVAANGDDPVGRLTAWLLETVDWKDVG